MIVGTILLLMALGALILHLLQKVRAKHAALSAIAKLVETNNIPCYARDALVGEQLIKAGYTVALVRNCGTCDCSVK